jgi:hypothetical protein
MGHRYANEEDLLTSGNQTIATVIPRATKYYDRVPFVLVALGESASDTKTSQLHQLLKFVCSHIWRHELYIQFSGCFCLYTVLRFELVNLTFGS